jgi:hypothetical protein
LGRLSVGDIFHATCASSGASLICLIEAIEADKIVSRRVTTQDQVEFEIATGVALPVTRKDRCLIDSVTPLPPEIHDALLGLDRRMRSPDGDKPVSQQERDAFKFVFTFYPANPIAED